MDTARHCSCLGNHLPAGGAAGRTRLAPCRLPEPVRPLPPPARDPQHPRLVVLAVRARARGRSATRSTRACRSALPGLRAARERPVARRLLTRYCCPSPTLASQPRAGGDRRRAVCRGVRGLWHRGFGREQGGRGHGGVAHAAALRRSRAPRSRRRGSATRSTSSAGSPRPTARRSAIVERYDLRARPLDARGADLRSPSTTPPPSPTAAPSTCSAAIPRAQASRRRPRRCSATTPARIAGRAMPAAPTARAAHAAGVIGARLYAAGGAHGGGALTRLEVYDFAARPLVAPGRRCGSRASTSRRPSTAARCTCSPAARPGAATSPSPSATSRTAALGARCRRCASRAAGSPRRRSAGAIVVVGGEEGAGTIAEVESYDPRRRRWRSEPPLPTPRHGLGAVALRSCVFVLEGGPVPGLTYSDRVEALRIRG